MNSKQIAIIKKDMQGIFVNKRVLSTMLIVPLVLTIFLPSIFIFGAVLAPESLSDFQVLLDLLPTPVEENEQQAILELLLNQIMPVFFLMIPIMASSVMAASSFVGEKEKHTLETLLYSPLSVNELFVAKILACFFVGMAVSSISFVVMLSVVEAEVLFLTGIAILPGINWLVVLFLVAPAISIAGITITVRGSAKAKSMEEAQQCAVFLVFPMVALIVGQFGGVLLIDSWILLGLCLMLVIADLFLLRSVSDKFTYEKLVRG